MRTYGYKHSTDGGKRKTGWERTELYSKREATEWDVRVDVNALLTSEVVISNIKERLDDLSYVFVSGVEAPDGPLGTYQAPQNGQPARLPKYTTPTRSEENHLHLCVVLLKPGKRGDVLQLIRGSRKLGDEYCAPRNSKFSYAGWIIHHGKPLFKIDGEPLIRFESGTLPLDPFTEEVGVKIQGLLKKWGTPDMKQRFKGYTDILGDEKVLLRKQLERKQALVEKLQTEIFELRVKLE